MPRTRDLAIFVLTTDTIALPLAHARGVIGASLSEPYTSDETGRIFYNIIYLSYGKTSAYSEDLK